MFRQQCMALFRINCWIARFCIKYFFVIWICRHKRKRPGTTQNKDTYLPNTGPVLVKHNQALDSMAQVRFRGGRGGVWNYAWFPATGQNQESGLNLGRMRTVCRTAPQLCYFSAWLGGDWDTMSLSYKNESRTEFEELTEKERQSQV